MTERAQLCFAIAFIITLFSIWLVDPRKSTLNRYCFWLGIPVVYIITMSAAFSSIAGGLGVGLMFTVCLFLIYFRYRD